MDLVSGYKGMVGLVFGNDNSGSNEDSYVERLLDRISNGVLPDDRRNAMAELQSVVAESRGAQLAFGAMGFPVLMGVLKEERDDVEMIRGALETLVSALTPIDHAKGPQNEVQPALMNTDLLSREAENISLLLSLLSEEDFYVRYYTLQILTALLTNSQNRLQEAILTIPRGITRLMDMLMDREVIRNEALLLLTHLTREAEEIQKILVFEGAFEKIFSIIKEEGGSEGGVVVQDCLELLNNLLRNNASNQVLLRETLGFDAIISILKLRGSAYSFTQQKTINLLSALETINLLLMGGSESDPGKDMNKLTNRTVLVQNKVFDYLLLLGVESQWAPIPVRCAALRCIGDLIVGHPKNLDTLASKVLGEQPQVEPALNSILRIILRTSSVQEFIEADHVFKSFCERNSDGQTMLASTLIPQPYSMTHAPIEEDVRMSFGSMLLHGLTLGESDGDLETCCRAASVLSHILRDNIQCKERVLRIELESPTPSLGAPEPLMHRMVKYLALASNMKNKDGKTSTKENSYVQPIILKLLVTWLADCPNAIQCFLASRPHLTYLLELVSNPSATMCIRGLGAVLLGECVIYNKSGESGKDAFTVVDAISQKIGLTSYFLKFDEMMKSFLFSSVKPTKLHKPLTRSAAASMAEIDDVDEQDSSDHKNEDHPILSSLFDSHFVNFVKSLEGNIRETIVDVYSRPQSEVAVVPAELELKRGESDKDYVERLKSFVQKQCSEIQNLLGRNATLAENLAKTGGSVSSQPEQRTSGGGGSDRVQAETLRRDLQEASQRIEMLKAEKAKIESEASMYQNLAGKMESDLKSLSDAYNSLEQANFHLEKEVKALKSGGASTPPDVEAIRAEAREEAQKESEAELNDLLVCLGQEQSRVEKLSARLTELGEDVDKLLEGVGDDMGLLPEDSEKEEE
ncbi:golgin candidate 6 isoform X1 [Populus alba]|uniref:Vesicle tethering family protein n=3 Tax=Populus alba TaxID=43335 RepID=A0A4U5NN53_POPAL|nr:golgin candidate 6 isoform X2 [Populus alba]TKR84220.1 vesicle tethering family protein [Populus alba]